MSFRRARAPRRVGGYQLEDLVGEGAVGPVYRARDLRLQRTVALRVIAPDRARDQMTRALLNREATALASIDHPNVVPLYEVGESDGSLFIASRWVDGRRLRSLVRSRGPLEPVRAVRIVNQVAAALQALHQVGLAHLNVTSLSVLVTAADHAYLTGFGFVRDRRERSAAGALPRVTPNLDYVAPELVAGESPDTRVDVYQLGCVLFEALTGQVPYPRAGAVAKTYAHLFAGVPPARRLRPDVPGALDAVIARAMAKDPAERPQSVDEFATDSAGALDLTAPPWARLHAAGRPLILRSSARASMARSV